MFTKADYLDRVARLRTRMAEQGLDAVMVTGDFAAAMNYRYLSGHLPRDYQATTDRPHILVVTAQGGAILCHWTSTAAAKSTWVDAVMNYAAPLRHTDLVALFDSLGLATGRVGAELGDDQRLMMPVAQFDALRQALPQVDFVDAGPLLWSLRAVKSPAEVEAIRAGDRINMQALRTIFSTLKRGDTARDLQRICATAIIEAGAYNPPHSQIGFSSTSKKKGPNGFELDTGDLLFVDTGVVHEGYWAEFNRMGVVGQPSAEQQHWHGIAREINRSWWEQTLRPGITAEAALLDHVRIMEARGLTPAQWGRDKLLNPPYSHHAHGIGLGSSEPPRMRITDKTVLEAGMVINVETYINGDDGARYACEEDVVITQAGAEVLSEPDAGLFIIE